MEVLLLGGAQDPQILRVSAALAVRGVPARLVDTARFPGHLALSLTAEGVTCGGEALPVPRAVYVRGLACHPLLPSLGELFEAHPRRVIAAMEEKRALLESVLLLWQTQGARLVNSPEANAQHSRKPWQLALLSRAGLPVPAWLATNDPDALHAWLTSQPEAVYKPLAGGATVRKLGEADLADERLEQLAAAPVLFQHYVKGISIRAYVVGDRVVASAEIHSEELDYRSGEGAVVATMLSPAEQSLALQAARATGMPFAGVDLLRAHDQTWLLEVNPSPMFAVFEDKTGLDIAGPLAELLAKR